MKHSAWLLFFFPIFKTANNHWFVKRLIIKGPAWNTETKESHGHSEMPFGVPFIYSLSHKIQNWET